MSAMQEVSGWALEPAPKSSPADPGAPAARLADLGRALSQHQEAVIDAIELLRAELGPAVPSRHTLETALREARRATTLVRRLVELSGGSGETQFRELLVSTAQLAMETCPERLRIVVPSRLAEVAGDLALIQTIIAHVIKRAAGSGGNVEVSARQLPASSPDARLAGSAVVVRVQSVAYGGSRVDPSRAKVEELQILIGEDATTECSAHLIGYTSADLGRRFELHLPTPEIRRPAPTGWRAGKRALVVEGDPALVRCMHETLGYLGWQVDLAQGGPDTLAVYEGARRAGRPYGLIILDARSCQERSEIHGFALVARHDPEVRMVLCADDAEASSASGQVRFFDVRLPRPFGFADVHRMLA